MSLLQGVLLRARFIYIIESTTASSDTLRREIGEEEDMDDA